MGQAPRSLPAMNKSASPPLPAMLPTAWSRRDRCPRHLVMEDEDLTLTYRGPGLEDTDAASVRANAAVSSGFYYFE